MMRRALEKYIKKHSTEAGLWSKFGAFFISLMRAWYGDTATEGK